MRPMAIQRWLGSATRLAASLILAAVVAPPALALWGNSATYWPGAPVTIPVCWEPSSVANPAAREWVRDAVERTWARYARINFVGWGQCNAQSDGVRIQDRPGNTWQVPPGPGGSGSGFPRVNGRVNGMTIDSSIACSCNASTWPSCAAGNEHCVRSLAIHEFGHVLGFYHEEERADFAGSATCPQSTWPNNQPQSYGAYDVNSVMSGCGQPAGNPTSWRETLSAGDIAAVQRAYGRRIAGQVVSPRAHCLAAREFNPGNPGAEPFLWDCDEHADDQEWLSNRKTGTLRLFPSTTPGISACLFLSFSQGARTEIRDCDSTLAQRFQFRDVEIRGFGGKCLDLRNGATQNGTPIQVFDCFSERNPPTHNANQRWNIASDGTIHLAKDTSKCVALAAAKPQNGMAVVLWSCSAPVQQKSFAFHSDGTVRFGQGVAGKCLDVRSVRDADYLAGKGGPADLAPVQVFSCLSEQLNQKWNITGQIRGATGKCLDRPKRGDANGLVPWSWTCWSDPTTVAASAQIWDYYAK